MDIGFIELQHRDNVLKLMEICGMDMKQAYDLYVECGYNFQAAVNTKFSAVQEVPQQHFQPLVAPQYIPPQNFDPEELNQGGYYEDDADYFQYKQFRTNGKTFERKYPARGHENFFKSIIPKFFKSGDDESFKRNLEEYLDRHVNFTAYTGALSEAFNWSWKEKFPLAVIILNFAENMKPAVKQFFDDDHLIQKVVSEQFKAYGLNAKDYELEQTLKPFFNLQRDANSIIICRVNLLDQVQIVTRIPLNDSLDQIKKKVKQAKSECIQKELDESHIVKQYHQELRGNFNYQRPRTIKQSIKLREDKKLRRQQEEEFFKACQPKVEEKKEQIKPQVNKPPANIFPPQEKKYEQKVEIKPQPNSSVISAEKLRQMRQEKLSSLRKYSNGLTFKIRVPTGRNIIVQVDGEENVQYLFDFIGNQPDDLGFNNDLARKFDISIGFGGSETLRGKERKRIKEMFEDSEVLIVREL